MENVLQGFIIGLNGASAQASEPESDKDFLQKLIAKLRADEPLVENDINRLELIIQLGARSILLIGSAIDEILDGCTCEREEQLLKLAESQIGELE